MSSNRIEITRDVAAPPETVWRVLTDLAHAADTLSGVTRIEVLTDGDYHVGTTWRETRKMLGKEVTEEMEVTAVEAPRRTTIESDSSGVHYVSEFRLEPTADGTRLTMSFAGEQRDLSVLRKVTWAVFGKLGLKAAGKMMARDLEDIAARAEGTAR